MILSLYFGVRLSPYPTQHNVNPVNDRACLKSVWISSFYEIEYRDTACYVISFSLGVTFMAVVNSVTTSHIRKAQYLVSSSFKRRRIPVEVSVKLYLFWSSFCQYVRMCVGCCVVPTDPNWLSASFRLTTLCSCQILTVSISFYEKKTNIRTTASVSRAAFDSTK
jgi:hypothetical protein